MVCFHRPTPTSRPISVPIPMVLGLMKICGNVYAEPMSIPILIPIPMQMGTVPNLAPILVPIRCFYQVIFIVTLHFNDHWNWSQCTLLHIIGIGIGQWKHTISQHSDTLTKLIKSLFKLIQFMPQLIRCDKNSTLAIIPDRIYDNIFWMRELMRH